MKLMEPLAPPGRYDSADPFGNIGGRQNPHTGSDWNGVPAGTAAKAIGTGVVVNKQWHSGNGNTVTVKLPDGHYYAYLHLNAEAPVAVGQTVTIGQAIGYVGNTGTNSQGAHLHITVSDSPSAYAGLGNKIDPWRFIQDHLEGAEPVAPANGVSFQTNVGSLGSFTLGGTGGSTGQGVASGTSPSSVHTTDGHHLIAFQTNVGTLGVYDVTVGQGGSLGYGMKAGSRPAIAALPAGGYIVTFQANTGNLFVYSSAGGAQDLQQGVAVDSSPAISVLPNGSWVIAFRSNTGNLFTYSSSYGYSGDTGIPVRPGTSPAIVALSDGSWIAAAHSTTSNLYLYTSNGTIVNSQQGMSSATSPALAALPNAQWVAAFHANNHNLFAYGANGISVNTGQGMATGTSPAAAAAASGYNVAFQSNTGQLYVYASVTGMGSNTGQGMAAGTSPGIG